MVLAKRTRRAGTFQRGLRLQSNCFLPVRICRAWVSFAATHLRLTSSMTVLRTQRPTSNAGHDTVSQASCAVMNIQEAALSPALQQLYCHIFQCLFFRDWSSRPEGWSENMFATKVPLVACLLLSRLGKSWKIVSRWTLVQGSGSLYDEAAAVLAPFGSCRHVGSTVVLTCPDW